MLDAYTIQTLWEAIPGLETLTLQSRQPVPANPENTFTSVMLYKVRRKPATKSDLLSAGAVLGQTWWRFEVYDPNLTTPPKVGDKLTDANNATYEVRQVDVKLLQTTYDCLVLQDM